MPKIDKKKVTLTMLTPTNIGNKNNYLKKKIYNEKNIHYSTENIDGLLSPVKFETIRLNNSDVTMCDCSLSSSTSTKSLNHVVVFNNQL